MSRTALALALCALCFASTPSFAQLGDNSNDFPSSNQPKQSKFLKLADVNVQVSPQKAKWGETVTVKLTLTPKPGGGWTYPAVPKDPKQESKNDVVLPGSADLIFIGTVTDSVPTKGWKEKPRPLAINGEQDQYTQEPVTWEFKAVVSPRAKAGRKEIPFEGTRLQVCNESNCYYARTKDLPDISVEVIEGISDKVNSVDLAAAIGAVQSSLADTKTQLESTKTSLEKTQKALEEALKAQKGTVSPSSSPNPETRQPKDSSTSTDAAKVDSRKVAKESETYSKELDGIAGRIESVEKPPPESLWGFILTAAAWGLISLVTPCVFPMIPITVSIFLKQADHSLRERLKLAGVYSFTIILVLGVSALVLLKFMAWLSTQPLTNVLLGVLFIALALSLFGMYELSLPNSLQRRFQAKQAKGGIVGTVFGALAFTVISFTCVAPFLGGFAGISAGSDSSSGGTIREVAGALAFSTAFAAPFFVLALVPGLLKALPKSGGWLDSVKVVMGFLELAAAFKFLRTAELRTFSTPQFFTYDVVLGGWIAISAACGLYLLNVFRLPHDEEKPNIGVPRLLFALAFLGLALYLTPGLFKGPDGKPQRPSGTVYAWVEAFLLPEDVPTLAAAKDDVWRTDLAATIEASEKSQRPIFLDFTGVTCANCKINEQTVFPQPAVRDELQKFEKVKLYTDEVPAFSYVSDPGKKVRDAEGAANGKFQIDVFNDDALPLYAVVMPQPDGKLKVIGRYPEGKINDPAKFVEFLKDAQEKAKPKK